MLLAPELFKRSKEAHQHFPALKLTNIHLLLSTVSSWLDLSAGAN